MGFLDATGITTLVNKLKTKFQPLLVSGTNIKMVGGYSLLGSGNVPFPTVPIASDKAPLMDGTASSGSGTAYARGNHRHPTDTSRQETLVSGTNIKTINGTSLLGSGNITTPDTDEKVSTVVASSDNTIYYPVLGNATTSAETKYYDPKFSYYRDSSVAELVVGSANSMSDNTDQANLELITKTGGAVIKASGLTHFNEYTLPNKGGTFALTSDTNKVTQNNSTSANDFRVLLSNTVSDSNETTTANKSANLRFMPSTSHLYVGNSGVDALITVSPRMHLGAFNRYDQTGQTESSTSYGVGLGINNGLAYSSYLADSSLLFQHWNSSRPSGGVPSSTNYVASMCSISHAHVLLRDYSGKEALTTQSELTSATLRFTNSAGTVYTVTPTKIDKWDEHTENGNYNLTAATTQAVYPIKIDNRGHISAYGSAVTIPTASTTAPAMDGTASYGSGTVYARSNHVHPTDTSRAAKDNFQSFTVSSTTTTKSLTSGHIYLLVTKRVNNSAAGGLYIVAPHTTTGSVTEVKAGTGTTVSINKVTLTVTTTANNIYCRLVDLNMPD